jgi:5-(carboxyamino)imidazole ribonucleotide synthase
LKIGILGGGQLARMMILAGASLGIEFRVYDPDRSATAFGLAPGWVGDFDDIETLSVWAEGLDAVTTETELVPASTLAALMNRVEVRPGPHMQLVCQDRLEEKAACERLGIPVAPWRLVSSARQLEAARQRLGGELIVKARTGGYDGRGQVRVGRRGSVAQAWEALGSRAAIAEAVVGFEREVSIIGVRDSAGRILTYPVIENLHTDGILRRSIAPAPSVGVIRAQAEDIIRALMEDLGTVGVLTVEMFEVDGRLLVNELAPRVHNSGHWTLQASETSQFENHIRAVAGLPLGSTVGEGAALMWNLIGDLPDPRSVLSVPGASMHDYAKTPRPGRKVGHVTVTAACPERLRERVAAAADTGIFPAWLLDGLAAPAPAP